MDFWRTAWFQKLLRDVVIALLVSLLSILGYHQTVVQPQVRALHATAEQGHGR
jgi:hypothetical protein